MSPILSEMPATDALSSQPESPLSEPQVPSAAQSPSTSVESERGPASDSDKDDLSSPSVSDEDAEGSADEQYDLGPSAPARSSLSQSARSSSSPDPNSRKRKLSEEDMEEAILAHPELYGVRRSVHARQKQFRGRIADKNLQVRSRIVPRRVLESSEEDNALSDSDMPQSRTRRKQRPPPKSSKVNTPAQATESDSDSEAFVGRRRDVLSKKAKQRRRDVLHGNAAPTAAEVRFSTRQRNPTTNYNEDEEGMNDDLIDEDAVQEWIIDTSPYVDKVLYHRLPEGATWDKDDLDKTDFEYLVKWQGSGTIHATWEMWTTLKSCRGFKKVQNYAVNEKNGVNLHISLQTDKWYTADEKESYMVNYELLAEQVANQNKPERVIGSQVIDGETQYYIKWKAQDYDQSTWEPEDAFANQPEESQQLYQSAIDDYIRRSQNLPKSTKLTTRPQFKRFTEQPDYIKFGTLRDFQLDGLNRLCLHWTGYHNVMLADEMGLGKTIQTVSFLNFLRHDRNQQGPFLVCVPLSTMAAWADTFDNWTPDVNYIVYHGNKASLEIIQQFELLKDGKPRFNVLLTTYETVGRNVNFLKTFKWQFLAVDEAHRLKNAESQLYEVLLSLSFDSKLLITGTPMQNNLLELKSLMDFLMPGVIQVDPKLDLTDLEGAADQLAQLRSDISRYMIRRTKNNVMKELPPKTEKVLRVDLSDLQQEYCKNITLRNYDALNKGVQGQKVSLSNVLMELKKASNHPFLFPAAEERYWHEGQPREERLRDLVITSGKMMLLDKLLERLKREGHRVLIFSQMVMVLNILAEYLKLRGHKFQQLDGTTAAAARRTAIERFNAPGSDDFCFLLSTRAGGLGINLMTADTVIIFDSDWNPHADLQAMGRAHRIGQTKPVTIYRLVSADSIEEKILEAAKNKLILEYVTIQKGGQEKELQEQAAKKGVILGGEKGPSREDMARILKFGATKLFQPGAGNQKKLESLDIDAVLASAEEHNTELPADETDEIVNDNDDFLKAFEVTDVKIDDLGWDEIIPQEEVRRMQDEENERRTQEMIKLVAGEGKRERKKPGDDQTIEERNQRAAKKRARDAQREAAADVEDASDDTEVDPKRPLNESETRRLLKAYQQWGSIEEMQDKIMETAKLTKRDPLLVKSTIDEIVDMSKSAIAEDAKRLEELEKNTTKAATKKERKEVLIEYNKVKRLNATTMVERPAEMALIRTTVDQAHDKKTFRIGEAMKPAQDFTCNWGGREDGMLMVGIAKYGWGSWWEIRDDPELDMKDKCFLEEQRTANKESRREGGEAAEVKARKPTQVHLNRRANYLVSVLKAKASGDLDSLENHHRNIKKSTIPDGASVPGMPRRVDKPRHRAHSGVHHGHSSARDRTGTPDVRHSVHQRPAHSLAHRPESSNHRHSDQSLKRRHESGHHDGHKRSRTSDINGSANHHRQPQSSSHKKKGPRDEFADKRTQELMQPIMASLTSLTESTRGTTLDKKEKVRRIKEYTLKIGDWIDQQEEGKRDRYWEYVGHRCFSGSSASSMRAIFVKMDGERQTALANAGTGATPTPAPPTPAVPTPAAKQSSATPAVATPTNATPMSGIVSTPTPAPPAANGSANGSKSVEPIDVKMEEVNGNGNVVKVETTPLQQTATASS